MLTLIIHAYLGPTLALHASWKLFTLCFSHARPMLLKVYAAIRPITVQITLAGRMAPGASLKKEIPLGSDNTPPVKLSSEVSTEVSIAV